MSALQAMSQLCDQVGTLLRNERASRECLLEAGTTLSGLAAELEQIIADHAARDLLTLEVQLAELAHRGMTMALAWLAEHGPGALRFEILEKLDAAQRNAEDALAALEREELFLFPVSAAVQPQILPSA